MENIPLTDINPDALYRDCGKIEAIREDGWTLWFPRAEPEDS